MCPSATASPHHTVACGPSLQRRCTTTLPPALVSEHAPSLFVHTSFGFCASLPGHAAPSCTTTPAAGPHPLWLFFVPACIHPSRLLLSPPAATLERGGGVPVSKHHHSEQHVCHSPVPCPPERSFCPVFRRSPTRFCATTLHPTPQRPSAPSRPSSFRRPMKPTMPYMNPCCLPPGAA